MNHVRLGTRQLYDTFHIQTNSDLPCDYHTKDSDPSTISTDVKSLRSLPKWSASARIEQAKHREPLHDPYTGNYTNDQDFHQPHWKSSQIKLCQTQTTKIQHNTTTSLMQHADIKDNYPLWRSQATILKNILKILPRTKRYTQDAILKVSPAFPVSPGSLRTPTSSPNNTRKSPVIPAARSRESPANSPV